MRDTAWVLDNQETSRRSTSISQLTATPRGRKTINNKNDRAGGSRWKDKLLFVRSYARTDCFPLADPELKEKERWGKKSSFSQIPRPIVFLVMMTTCTLLARRRGAIPPQPGCPQLKEGQEQGRELLLPACHPISWRFPKVPKRIPSRCPSSFLASLLQTASPAGLHAARLHPPNQFGAPYTIHPTPYTPSHYMLRNAHTMYHPHVMQQIPLTSRDLEFNLASNH